MYINVPIYGTFFIVMKGVFIMAVNEQIVTGRKFRKLIDEANKLWQRISFWTKASDVEFNDGKNAETKFGAINGVTDSLTSTASNIAASAKAVKTLNDKVTQLNSNFTPEFELVEGVCKPGDVIDLKKQIVAIAIAYNRQSMLVSASFWAVSFGNLYRYPTSTNAIIIDGTKATLTYRGGVAGGGGTGDTDPADYYMALVVK